MPLKVLLTDVRETGMAIFALSLGFFNFGAVLLRWIENLHKTGQILLVFASLVVTVLLAWKYWLQIKALRRDENPPPSADQDDD